MGEYNHNTELQRKTCGWHIKTVSKGQSEKGRQLNLLTSGGKVSTGTLQSGRERDSKVHNTFSHQRNAMKGTSNRAAVMKRTCERLPWWSSGWDSSLPTKGAWVRSLVGELRSFMPCSATKKKKKWAIWNADKNVEQHDPQALLSGEWEETDHLGKLRGLTF